MSDFRKPYEYVEEPGMPGLLLFFFVLLLTLETVLGAATTIQVARLVAGPPALRAAVVAAGTAWVLLVLAACIALRRRLGLGVTLSKILLVARVPVLVPAYVAIFAHLVRLAGGYAALPSPGVVLVTRLAGPVAYIVLFSAAWLAYLAASGKVRQALAASNRRA